LEAALTHRADDGDALGPVVGDPAGVGTGSGQMPMIVMSLAGGDYRVTAVNAAFRELVGRPDLVGTPVLELVPELVGDQIRVLLDRVFATGKGETGRGWRIQLSQAPEPAEAFVDFAIEPVISAGLVVGLLVSGTDVTSSQLGRQTAERQANNAERRYLTAGDVIAELQEALLPTALPILPQARISARYLVTGHERTAGGDWFDAIARPDGAVVLVVGDVVGHGIRAAAAMGQLRAVLNEQLSSGSDLPAAVARVDAFAARTPTLRAATLAIAELDPTSGMLSYILCGHPPPLIVTPAATASFLPAAGGGPLGIGNKHEIWTAALPAGALLLMYSDGLVERPGHSLRDGMAELARVAASAAESGAAPPEDGNAAERICRLTVEVMTGTGYADDVTALAAERLAEPIAPLHLELPAVADSLTVVRRALRDWLAGVDAMAEDQDGVHMAVVEIVTNAIEHAYPAGQPGRVEFDLSVRPDGQLDCTVTDYGRWRDPDPTAAERGNGLMVAGHMVDQLRVSHPDGAPGAPAGTVIQILHRLRHPAVLAAAPTSTPQPDTPPAGLPVVGPPLTVETEHDGKQSRAWVRGPVDIGNSDELLRRLLAACRGGTLPLRVNLTGVSQLASAGVSALYQLARQLAAHDNRLELVVANGGAVQAVLEVVGLAGLAWSAV
jgi:serine phosphatase RsbU (regulator of sigma subunit)/anti-sigma regulatory factor (Ser/Thr protein kinase)/anti-anti-sigma regulatory factor